MYVEAPQKGVFFLHFGNLWSKIKSNGRKSFECKRTLYKRIIDLDGRKASVVKNHFWSVR